MAATDFKSDQVSDTCQWVAFWLFFVCFLGTQNPSVSCNAMTRSAPAATDDGRRQEVTSRVLAHDALQDVGHGEVGIVVALNLCLDAAHVVAQRLLAGRVQHFLPQGGAVRGPARTNRWEMQM